MPVPKAVFPCLCLGGGGKLPTSIHKLDPLAPLCSPKRLSNLRGPTVPSALMQHTEPILWDTPRAPGCRSA